jgi:outer membrane protein
MNRMYLWARALAGAVLVVALSVRTAPAQVSAPAASPVATIQLTLEDAIRRAKEYNPDLAVTRLATQAENARVDEALSAFVPMFSSIVGRSSNVSPPSNFLLGDRGIDSNDLFSSTGIRQRLARGSGTWTLSWDTSRTTTSNPISSFEPSLQSGFQVAFSQPLLKDRKIDAARQQTIIATRNQESSELRLGESTAQTLAAVKQAYWTLKATMANVAVQQRSLDLAHELARQNRARVDVGQAPPLDLVQAESEVAQRRETLIRATAAAGDAEDRLRRLIMDPSDISFWNVRIDPVDDATGAGPLLDVDAAVTGALRERFDLARARKDLEKAGTNLEFLDNQRLPDVRLEASYRGSGLGGTQFLRSGGFPGTITGTLDRSYGDVLGQMFGRTYPTWSLGVSVNYSLGKSFEEAQFARTEIERRQVGQRIASLQLQAAEAIRQAGRQVTSTAERIDAAKAGTTLAERRLETEQRRFEAGLSTSFLVTQAQRDLLQAQVNLLQATLDHQSALVSFEALQQAPALGSGDTANLGGGGVAQLPTLTPRGAFRLGAGSGF